MRPSDMQMPDRIEAERVFLRPYREDDAPLLRSVAERNEAHLREFESGNLLMQIHSDADAESTIRDVRRNWDARDWFLAGVFEKRTGAWAGQIYVAPTNWDLPEFTIGYVADVDHEGRGYISEAVRATLCVLFVDVGALRVVSDCHERNVRSRRLLERCGFTREGHLRQNRRSPDGSVHGDYLYGILASEYFDGSR